MVLEKTLVSPLDCKEIQPVYSKGDRKRRVGKECQTLFLGAPKSLQIVNAAMTLKDAYSLEESYDKPT